MNRCRSALLAIASPVLAFATLVALLFALAGALFIGEAHAQVAGSTTATVGSGAASSPVFGMMQGLVGLVIVVGLIFAAGWLMKKIGPRTRSSGVVQVVGGASVGPREKVVVVRFNGQTLLLGVAPGQVSLLHTVDPDATIDHDVAPSASPSTTPSFRDRLRSARSGA